jgi:hypothetical protein
VSGTDASGADYRTKGVVGGASTGNISTNYNQCDFINNSGILLFNGDFFEPFLTKRTFAVGTVTTGGIDFGGASTGQHSLTNSYDGFTVLTSTGNITGTIRVYGYKKS